MNEFNEIMDEYLETIKPKINNYIERYFNKFFNKREVFINIFDRHYELLNLCRTSTYNNIKDNDFNKLRRLRGEGKLKDIFICCCGAIYTTFTYDHYVQNHQYLYRHTNFINLNNELKQIYESDDFKIINFKLIQENEERLKHQYLYDSSESESDSSDDD